MMIFMAESLQRKEDWDDRLGGQGIVKMLKNT